MRTIAAGLVAFALVAGLAAASGAQAQSEKQKRYAKKTPRGQVDGTADGYAGRRQNNGYTEYRVDNMRFGSSGWWEQMRREGRLGGETP
jgi:hypothetical protein